MDEAVLVPNIETIPDARDTETARMLDRLFVPLVFHDESIEDIAAMIDEMNAIFSQAAPNLLIVQS